MVTDAPGRHRRFEAEPFSTTGYMQAPAGMADPEAAAPGAWEPAPGASPGREAGRVDDLPTTNAPSIPDWPPDADGALWPRWNASAPVLHPDHPSAPVPRVRAPRVPALSGPGMPGPDMTGRPSRPGMAGRPGGPPGSAAFPQRRPGAPAGRGNGRPQPSGSGPRLDGPTGGNTAWPNRPVWGDGPIRPDGPVRDYGTGQGYAPPPPPRPGPAPPGGIDSGHGYPQPQGLQAGRRLYAVPDSTAAGAGSMGAVRPGGSRAVPFGAGQAAVALADPAWRGEPQDGSFQGGQMPAMPGGQPGAVGQAWSQATAIREAAEKEAEAIRREALAIRETAEKEAARMRAAILAMSEQLSQMAAYVNQNFPPGGAAPAFAAGAPAALAAGAPAALAGAPPAVMPERPTRRPAGPATRPGRPAISPERPGRPGPPATRPGPPATRPARPGARPGRPATRPGTSQGRQARAARKMFALLAVMVAAGAITGAAQIALHGGRFFIFRENGAGASETGLTDGQFPGHPGAPAPPAPKHAK